MAPAFDEKQPHMVHASAGKINVYDQNGHLYDGVKKELLEASDVNKERYAFPEGGVSLTRVATPEERFEAALATLKASNALSSEDLAKLSAMLSTGGEVKETAPVPETPKRPPSTPVAPSTPVTG